MARPGRSARNRTARSFRQLRRFHHVINSDKVFGTHTGSLVDFQAVAAAAGLIVIFLAIKMATKFIGILPLTRTFSFEPKKGMYTTLLMSTGLTFGTISALFGLTNHIIDQEKYTILVTVVIGSAVVPTLIAQRWFQPTFKSIENEHDAVPAAEEAGNV